MEIHSLLVLAAKRDQAPDFDGAGAAAAGGAIAATMIAFYVIILVIIFASLWRIFTKAGKPGWAAIIPIYNMIVILEIVGKPIYWVLLWLIPCVNIVIGVLVMIELAKVFGKDVGFAVGLILLGIVFLPILAFGSARYQGPPQQTY